MFDYDLPWIKFVILSIPLIVVMWIFAPTLKWKLVFSVAVPIGVGLALSGRSINFHKRRPQ